MLEHIVKNGETVHDILNMYHIELEELKAANLHITDLYNLASGMKIKVPMLHNEIEQILENTESFVQKYYPKVHDLYEEKPTPPVIEVQEEMRKEEPPLQVPPSPPTTKGRPYPGIVPPGSYYKR